MHKALAIVSIIVVGIAIYANSFGNKFLFDDIKDIVNNQDIKSLANIPKAFSHHLSSGGGGRGKFYRPIEEVTLAIDHFLWGLEPAGYHITNTLLHIIVTILFFLLMCLVIKDWALSWAASILYLVHPVHTEAITYIAGRADPIAAIFLLIMVLFQYRYWNSAGIARAAWYGLILISFILGLFSKESAIIFPAFLMLFEYCFREDKKYSSPTIGWVKFYGPLFAIMAGWFIIKNSIVPMAQMVKEIPTLKMTLLTAAKALSDYIFLSFFPLNLHMEYKFPYPRSVFQEAYFGPVVISLLFLGALYFFWKKGRSDKRYRIVFFGFAWFFLGLLIYLNIIFKMNAPFSEHWLYVPEIGFIMAVVYGLAQLFRATWGRKFVISLCAAAALIFSFLTIRQNAVWKDSITFYTYTLKLSPHSAAAYNNLAVEYMDRGDYAKAKKLLKKAYELRPDLPEVIHNIRRANLEDK